MNCTKEDVNASGQTNNQDLVNLIGKVTYYDSLVGIFTDSSEKNPRRFFFEPIVQLDPNSISCQTHQLFKQDVVRFSIKMWDSELRSRVLERVQSMPNFRNLEIHEEDICVMPYKEVQLVLKPGSDMDQSIQLMNQPTSFHPRSSNSLGFYFICDSPSTAATLADNFREYPEFILEKFKLALACHGMVLGNRKFSSKTPFETINVSAPQQIETIYVDDKRRKRKKDSDDGTDSSEDDSDSDKSEKGEPDARVISLVEAFKHQNQYLTGWMLAMPANKWPNAVTVFSVVKCTNPYCPLPKKTKVAARKSTGGFAPRCPPFPGQLSFSLFKCETKLEHGDFNLQNGTFTVKTSGLYLLHFSGYYEKSRFSYSPGTGVKLNKYQADGSFVTTIATTVDSGEVRRSKLIEYPPVIVSALLPLKAGDKIVAFTNTARLHEAPPAFTTRFTGILFSDELLTKQILASQ